MKRYTNLILIGIILILAAVLSGVLIFLKNQPPQNRATAPVVNIAPLEPDSAKWGLNFPNQWSSLQKTADNHTATKYGGSDNFSQLAHDPRLVILFAGNAFSKDYNEDRGHAYSLTDVRATKRLTDTTHATCYSCKSSDNPALWAQQGMEAYDAQFFGAMTPQINNPIGCANCHEANTMRLIVTNPALETALQAQGKDWRTFSRQEMRSLVCANCHVEYYLAGDKKVLTLPWAKGTGIDQIVAYYTENGFKDWEYPGTKTPILKAQHPEYEMYTAGSTHYMAGVSCADCHMPYMRDGAAKYSSHDIHSPLLKPEAACGQCHTDVTYVVGRVGEIQDQVSATKLSTEDALVDAIMALQGAAANPKARAKLLDEARQLHRKAQFMWDFVAAENSTGFHNPEYVLKILAESTNLARQAQMKAAQAANDANWLATGLYATSQPAPTATPKP
jgi:nitrite reductase (cytochrome c-552)